jgi:formate--tetrahydrofolate ligase
VVTEAGFGADLGAEKFFDIKCRKAGLKPQGRRDRGHRAGAQDERRVAKDDLGTENVDAVKNGCPNLGRHIENVKKFGVPVIVASTTSSPTPMPRSGGQGLCHQQGGRRCLCQHWAEGSEGTKELATKVVEIVEAVGAVRPALRRRDGLFEKIETVAKRIYRADEVIADKKIRDQLKAVGRAGYGNLPVCMAKTQYSFTTDPNKRGAPTGFDVPVREVRLSAGAGFVVAICGEIMTMPGLPRKPAAETIRLNDEGQIEGLF